jgi:LmbE family N-acetylglucosaminyl deacetylase
MHIDDSSQLRGGYDHVYLSPHMDDAALSCGGAIAAQRAAGERVLVVTLCTASPAPDAQFSALAQEFHQQWGLDPAQAIAERLNEERRALRLLDADSYWAVMLDAIYRYPEAYNTRESLFGTLAPDDPLFADLRSFIPRLRERLPDATLYAPLGVGLHVDHQVTHSATVSSQAGALLFYEDLPYAIKPGALDERLAMLKGRLSSHTISIDATFATKLEAIGVYASQLEELFGGAEAMVRAITDYTMALHPAGGVYGERLWFLTR